MTIPPGQLRTLLVSGSQGWIDHEVIDRRMRDLVEQHDTFQLIHGGAKGADLIAHEAAKRLGLPKPRVFPPVKEARGRSGPILRNIQMLDEKPDGVLAFWDGYSPGTQFVIVETARRGIPLEVITPRL